MNRRSEVPTRIPRPAIGESLLAKRDHVVINYHVSGRGETVILLPAFARAASDYNELAASLNERGYRTVAVELRGMGQSISPVFPRASMHDFAADVAHVISALDNLVGGKAHVVGRAFGARVARTLAADHPHLVRSVVLLAGGGAIGVRKSGLMRYAICNMRFMPRGWRVGSTKATLYAPGNEPPPHLVYRHSLRAVRRQFFALRTPLEEVWRGRATPILWVHGEDDVLVPLANVHAWCDRFPEQVKLVLIPQAGHALIPEQPEAVLEAIVAFLREHGLKEAD